jgi:hypothetical protein
LVERSHRFGIRRSRRIWRKKFDRLGLEIANVGPRRKSPRVDRDRLRIEESAPFFGGHGCKAAKLRNICAGF